MNFTARIRKLHESKVFSFVCLSMWEPIIPWCTWNLYHDAMRQRPTPLAQPTGMARPGKERVGPWHQSPLQVPLHLGTESTGSMPPTGRLFYAINYRRCCKRNSTDIRTNLGGFVRPDVAQCKRTFKLHMWLDHRDTNLGGFIRPDVDVEVKFPEEFGQIDGVEGRSASVRHVSEERIVNDDALPSWICTHLVNTLSENHAEIK